MSKTTAAKLSAGAIVYAGFAFGFVDQVASPSKWMDWLAGIYLVAALGFVVILRAARLPVGWLVPVVVLAGTAFGLGDFASYALEIGDRSLWAYGMKTGAHWEDTLIVEVIYMAVAGAIASTLLHVVLAVGRRLLPKHADY